MAPYTTLADFQDYAGDSYESTQDSRVIRMISLAERMLVRRTGVDFFSQSADAAEDWVFATCVVADWLLVYDDPEVRADISGPYQSGRLGDWAFTLRKDMWTPFQDLRIRDIISTYSLTRALPNIAFITAVGPRTLREETTEG